MGDVEFFALFVIQNLVKFPENVRVEKTVDEHGTLLSATVDPSDAGRVIGKQGATARSLRQLLHALGMKHGVRYSLRIIGDDAEERVKNA